MKVENSTLKAVSYNNQIMGAVHSEEFGIAKEGWRLIEASSERSERMAASQAFDAVTRTYWQTEEGAMPHFIAIDLGDNHTLKAMKYTPQTFHGEGMMAKGIIQVSSDGKEWMTVESFEFGNLINDPSPRTHRFDNPVTTRYIRVEATEIAGNGASLAIAELDFI